MTEYAELGHGGAPVAVTSNSELRISLMGDGGLTAFGQLPVANSVAHAGWTFAYTILEDLISTTVTGSGTTTNADAHGIVSTTAATSSSAMISTKKKLRYVPGIGGRIIFTALFTPGVTGSQQFIGIGDPTADGFFFAFDDDNFGVACVRDGVEMWIYQTAWSHDTMDGSGDENNPSGQLIDTTQGNVYQIKYQWLGYGAIQFFVENSTTGELVLVHRIAYANNYTQVSILNPTLPVAMYVVNTTNATNIVLKSSSAMGFLDGGDTNGHPLAQTHGISNSATVTTEAPVLAIRGAATFHSLTNRVTFFLERLGVAVDGTKPTVVNMYRNPATITGASWVSIETDQSTVEYDISATAFTGGDLIGSQVLPKTGGDNFDLQSLHLDGSAGDVWLVTASSSSSTDAFASFIFEERF